MCGVLKGNGGVKRFRCVKGMYLNETDFKKEWEFREVGFK